MLYIVVSHDHNGITGVDIILFVPLDLTSLGDRLTYLNNGSFESVFHNCRHIGMLRLAASLVTCFGYWLESLHMRIQEVHKQKLYTYITKMICILDLLLP